MKAIVVFCLFAAVFTMQMSKHQLPLLKSNSYGNLFAQIKDQMKSGGPLANVEGLLDDLESQIRNEQTEHDEMLGRNEASCKTEETFRNNEVAEGNGALRRAKNHLAACSSSLEQTKVNLAQTVQDIADSQAALQTATQRREQGKTLFQSRQADHRQALGVVQGALQILDDLVAEEASLVQLSSHTANLLRTGVKISLSHKYAPVIALFAQMATSEFDMFLDAGAVERVRSMLSQLYQNVEESLQDYTNEEAAAQENFNALKGKLEQSLRDLHANKVALEDHQEEMSQCVLEEKLLVAKANEKVSRNSKLLKLSKRMCQSFRDEHTAATDSRDEELKLLGTVRSMVRRRLEGVAHSVVSRDDEFVNEAVDSYDKSSFTHNGGNRDNALEGYGF